MDPQNLITLASFRKQNGLKQAEMGEYLQTSGSYVSLVEKGNARLSRKSLENFWSSTAPNKTGLVPAYDRLVQLGTALYRMKKYPLFSLYYAPPEEECLYEPFEDMFTREAIYAIKFGEVGISEEIAFKLKDRFGSNISKDWLISGIGEMFADDTFQKLQESIEGYFRDVYGTMERCHSKLETIEKKLDLILSKLDIT